LTDSAGSAARKIPVDASIWAVRRARAQHLIESSFLARIVATVVVWLAFFILCLGIALLHVGDYTPLVFNPQEEECQFRAGAHLFPNRRLSIINAAVRPSAIATALASHHDCPRLIIPRLLAAV
jgi:hypothetical protein